MRAIRAWGARLGDGLQAFFFAPASPGPLGILRIALAVLLAIEWALLAGSLEELFGPRGLLQVDLMNAVTGRSVLSYAAWLEERGIAFAVVLYGFYLFRWVVLLTFGLGIFTRTSTFLLWATQVVLMSSGAFSVYGLDRYFHLLLFLMLFAPAGEAYALSLRKGWSGAGEPSVNARFALRSIQLSVLFTYVNAGVSKAMGQQWWSGDAVWRSLHMPEFQRYEFYWMADWPWIPQALALGTLFFETFYVLGVWHRRIGPAWAMVIISMHLGIALFLGLVHFGVSMAVLNGVLFLLPRWFEAGTPVKLVTKSIRI